MRGAAHRRQHRQAAGVVAEGVKLVIAGTRVTHFSTAAQSELFYTDSATDPAQI
jgi:hypothetical protein